MSVVFLDTVGMLAQWDQTDQWHEPASAALDGILKRSDRTITTTYVMLECGNAAARRPYRSFVAETRAALEASGQLIAPTADDWTAAWAAYASQSGDTASIVDHVSFVVMRRMGINDVFSNDKHFRAAGFHTLF